MIRLFILLALVVTFCLHFVQPAFAGHGLGNSGDAYAAEFTNIGRNLSKELQQNPIQGISNQQLLEALSSTKVTSIKNFENEPEVPKARCNPQSQPPSIVLNRSEWDKMAQNPIARAREVLHQYLCIMGIDDSEYKLSNHYEPGHICDRTPSIVRDIESYVGIRCDRVLPSDLQKRTEGHIYTTAIVPGDLLYFSGLNSIGITGLIENLEAGALTGMTNLNALYIHHPVQRHFGDDIFLGLPQLESLRIDSNMQSLSSETFRGLSKLKVLTSKENQLRRLPSGVFRSFHVLEKIHIRANQLEALETGAFNDLPQLRELALPTYDSVAPNCLREIQEGSFLKLDRLEKVDLCINFKVLGLLQKSNLQGLENISELYIRVRGSFNIRPGTLKDFSKLKVLTFSAETEANPAEIQQMIADDLPDFVCEEYMTDVRCQKMENP